MGIFDAVKGIINTSQGPVEYGPKKDDKGVRWTRPGGEPGGHETSDKGGHHSEDHLTGNSQGWKI
ncbi:hypothetical protein A2686_04000 [Candidatus Woesebacteria bacterium RIFCSPHIGHO2_01_FULL_38_10]|nr:MAG: hypothetical protein A2686_04000 [Candidatus Woesebacteria bacterium RIFCSPHIGHO2_01_FULL_38_10]